MKAKALNTNAVVASSNSNNMQQATSSALIFRTNLNNKFKLTPFNTTLKVKSQIKYLPAVSKEWKNTIYSYYKKNMQNLPIDNINVNRVLQSYFNLHFVNDKFRGSESISPEKRSLLLQKIYVSKIETKHTNSKTIITLYTINTEKNIVYKNYKKFTALWENKVLDSFKKGLEKKIRHAGAVICPVDSAPAESSVTEVASGVVPLKLLVARYKFLTESLQCFNLYLRLYLSKQFKKSYFDKLGLLRSYQLNYYLNKFKYEKNTYLHKLSNMYGAQAPGIFNNIEFNIVNLKSVAFHPEIFTEIISLKLRKFTSAKVVNVMDSLLKEAKLPIVDTRWNNWTPRPKKSWTKIENAHPNLSLATLLGGAAQRSKQASKHSSPSMGTGAIDKRNGSSRTCSLSSLLEKRYLNRTSYNFNISRIIFNSIKYKNLGGVRLEVKGRLTKRNRADRSQVNFKWKGGLRNVESSYKRLSTVTYRGQYKPNIIYSISQSKRPVGSFAVKGWASGK